MIVAKTVMMESRQRKVDRLTVPNAKQGNITSKAIVVLHCAQNARKANTATYRLRVSARRVRLGRIKTKKVGQNVKAATKANILLQKAPRRAWRASLGPSQTTVGRLPAKFVQLALCLIAHQCLATNARQAGSRARQGLLNARPVVPALMRQPRALRLVLLARTVHPHCLHTKSAASVRRESTPTWP